MISQIGFVSAVVCILTTTILVQSLALMHSLSFLFNFSLMHITDHFNPPLFC